MDKRHTVAYIGVASNIDPERNIARGLQMLSRSVRMLGASTFYVTAALKRPDDPSFLNGVVAISTDLPARRLKSDVLRGTESALGRIRTEDPYAPRTLDLDLLLYGDEVISDTGTRVPDPDIRSRAFLAAALVELDPELVLADTSERIADFVRNEELDRLEPAIDFSRRMKEKYNE